MFCEQCGAELEPEARFCSTCGRQVAFEHDDLSDRNMFTINRSGVCVYRAANGLLLHQ